jgi:hypothetical protein
MKHNSDWDICDPVPVQGESPDYPERTLLCAIVNQGMYDAARGDIGALNWFREENGSFALFAHFLGWNVRLIRLTLNGNGLVCKRKINIRARGTKHE